MQADYGEDNHGYQNCKHLRNISRVSMVQYKAKKKSRHKQLLWNNGHSILNEQTSNRMMQKEATHSSLSNIDDGQNDLHMHMTGLLRRKENLIEMRTKFICA